MRSAWPCLTSVLVLALPLSIAEADSSTGQIVIRGSVEPVCALEVVDYGTRLDLVDGEKGAAVGVIRETCNGPEGYTLSFSSRSGGRLLGSSDRQVAYRISYDGLLDEALGSDRQLGRAGPEWNREHELLVDLVGQPDLPAGEYNDVIIVEIVAR